MKRTECVDREFNRFLIFDLYQFSSSKIQQPNFLFNPSYLNLKRIQSLTLSLYIPKRKKGSGGKEEKKKRRS